MSEAVTETVSITSEAKPVTESKPEDVKFDDAQQRRVNDLIAAERKRTEEATATRIKTEADEAKRKADAEAQRKRDEEAGKFDAVRQSLEEERDAVKASLDAATTELDALRAYVKADVTAVTKQVKDAKDSPAAAALLDFYPGDDADSQTLLRWAEKAKARMPEIEGATARTSNGPNPKPATGHFDKDAAAAEMRRKGTFRI